jgi:hypothetical protein
LRLRNVRARRRCAARSATGRRATRGASTCSGWRSRSRPAAEAPGERVEISTLRHGDCSPYVPPSAATMIRPRELARPVPSRERQQQPSAQKPTSARGRAPPTSTASVMWVRGSTRSVPYRTRAASLVTAKPSCSSAAANSRFCSKQ